MRDANKINHGDEKLIVRILYGGFDAYEKSKNGKLKNKIRYKLYKALNHFFVKWLCGADIPLSVKMGGGIRIPHSNGIIIHGDAILGENITIFQQVAIGVIEGKSKEKAYPPRIGNNVYIGAGAKILGNITVGDNVKIGANAVVTRNVPNDVTVVQYNRFIYSKGEENGDT